MCLSPENHRRRRPSDSQGTLYCPLRRAWSRTRYLGRTALQSLFLDYGVCRDALFVRGSEALLL